MKLPYRLKAFIPPEKIDDYLLSSIHEKGKYKAAFFKKIGFDTTNKALFEKSLLQIALNDDVVSIREIINKGKYFGKLYVIEGKIELSKVAKIKTVWKLLQNKRKPSLVTVTPL